MYKNEKQRNRKIGRMQAEFGKISDKKCKECSHFKIYDVHGKRIFKCEVYGTTNSEASDWRASYEACGMFNDDKWTGIEMMKKLSERPKAVEQIEGQLSLFD